MAKKIKDTTYDLLMRKSCNVLINRFAGYEGVTITSIKCAIITVNFSLKELKEFNKDHGLADQKSRMGEAFDYRIWHLENVKSHLMDLYESMVLQISRNDSRVKNK